MLWPLFESRQLDCILKHCSCLKMNQPTKIQENRLFIITRFKNIMDFKGKKEGNYILNDCTQIDIRYLYFISQQFGRKPHHQQKLCQTSGLFANSVSYKMQCFLFLQNIIGEKYQALNSRLFIGRPRWKLLFDEIAKCNRGYVLFLRKFDMWPMIKLKYSQVIT